MNKIIAYFFFTIITFSTFSQNKKEQIETLKIRTDSLTNVLANERETNFARVQELIYLKGLGQNQIDSLQTELKNIKNFYDKKELENTQLKYDLNLNLAQISKLKIQLINKTDSLIIIANELKQIKSKIQNAYTDIPENNFDILVTKFVNKEKNITHYNNWISNIIVNDEDGDKTYVTKKCLEYTNDVIQNYSGYDGSIDEETLTKKWSDQYDLKYSNFSHLFETGNCGWSTKKLTKTEYLGELNKGDWFKLTIKGGCEANDFSTTIVRIIKVIKIGNGFHIDTFLSLTEE